MLQENLPYPFVSLAVFLVGLDVVTAQDIQKDRAHVGCEGAPLMDMVGTGPPATAGSMGVGRL